MQHCLSSTLFHATAKALEYSNIISAEINSQTDDFMRMKNKAPNTVLHKNMQHTGYLIKKIPFNLTS